MAYKKLIKVSNVCQLLDKRTYPATTTINGVAVSAKDNAFYVTGTCIQSGGRNNKLSETIVLRPGRYYFYTFNASEAVPCLSKNIDNSIIVAGNSNMFTVEETTECYFGINFVKDIVYSGYLKPQLLDLTEMYGAGHEPTTVEQFRQDFPEEMYDYTPRCWLTSYKRVFMTGDVNYLTSYQRNLTCKTKNLFDINSANVTIKDDGTFTSNVIHNYNFYSLNVTPGETYTVNYYIVDSAPSNSLNLSVQTGDYYTDGKQLLIVYNSSIQNRHISRSFKIPEGATKITFSTAFDVIRFRNFMLELGDTATDYVPYGHL